MPVADDVIVELEARVDGYNRKLDGAVRKFDGTVSSINGGAQRMGKGVSLGMGLAAGAVGGFVSGLVTQLPGAIYGAIKSGLEYASALQEQATQLGVTTDELQEYRYAATQVGLTEAQMDNAFRMTTRTLGQLQQGVKKPVEALKDLGFTVKEMAEISRGTAGEALPKIAEAMKKIENPTERARLAIALFGRSGMALLPLMEGGADGVNSLRNAAKSLGIVLSKKEIADADKTADKLAEVQTVLKAKIAKTVAENAGSIIDLADALGRLAKKALDAGRDWEIMKAKMRAGNGFFFANVPGLTPGEANGMRSNARRNQAFANGQSNIEDAPGVAEGRARFDQKRSKYLPKPQKVMRGMNFMALQGDDIEANISAALTKIEKKPTTKAKPATTAAAATSKAKGDETDADKIKTTAARRAKEATDRAREAAETVRRYTDDLATLNADLAVLGADLLGTDEARLEAAKAAVDTQTEINNRAVMADAELSATQKSDIVTRNNLKGEIEKEILNRDAEEKVRTQIAEDALATAEAGLNNEADALRSQLDMTKGRSERATIEKRLVEIAFELERLALDEVIASETATEAQKEIARRRLALLGQLEAGAKQNVDQGNKSPGQVYADELGAKVANIRDEVEQIAVDKFRELGDAMGDAVPKALGLKGMLGDLVGQLAKLAIQALIMKPLMAALFPGQPGAGGAAAGGGGLGGVISSVIGAFGKRAGGGPVLGGGSYLVGERGPEIFSPQSSGNIIPNHRLGQGGGAPVVQVNVAANDYFDARVEQVSGNVAVNTVAAAAPQIVEASTARTINAMSRPRM